MKIIVVASRKGGSGKTTLSGHLAVEAERMGGGPVALIDTDPQGSLSAWWNERIAQTPAFLTVDLAGLAQAVREAEADGFKLLVIDTPPLASEIISRVVAHADLILIPTRPSPHDMRAIGATIDIAERHGGQMVFVVNGAVQRARITTQIAIALGQHGPLAPVIIHHRTDFASSMTDGRTAGEIDPGSRSAAEIGALWAFLSKRLSRETRHAAGTDTH